jgi:hypothetical protein
VFDKPNLEPESIPHKRLKFIAGDFFECAPSGADAYLLRWVFHDWAEGEAALILESTSPGHEADRTTDRNRAGHSGRTSVSLWQVDGFADVGLSRRMRANRQGISRATLRSGIRFAGSGRYSFAIEPACCNPGVARTGRLKILFRQS